MFVSELESDLQDTVDWYRNWLVDFNAGKTELVLFDRSNITGAKLMLNFIDMKIDGSVLEEKSSFRILKLSFFFKLDCGSYIVSIVKTVSDKIWVLIRFIKYFPPEVGLCLFKSTIGPWMEYCCNAWAGAPSCYMEMLAKWQKWIVKTVRPSFAASLEPLRYRQNVAGLLLSCRYFFGRCSSELAQLVPVLYSRGRHTRYSEIAWFFRHHS